MYNCKPETSGIRIVNPTLSMGDTYVLTPSKKVANGGWGKEQSNLCKT